ncbi:hypothetical protein F5Y16DRAFT_20710 [Xylariaceae sp. FL0255]|nr:hypothetical protein F5Y16DRAFT_20710 [Xylariaceae sp. FL0255]
MNLVLGARAEQKKSTPDNVSHLPFSRSAFEVLIKELNVHGTIARIINRNTSCAFTRKFCSWSSLSERSIVYNCRSSGSFKGDMALSVTFKPNDWTTNAILYSCDESTTEDVIERLSTTDIEELHPMIMPCLFAELERDRLNGLVRIKISKLYQSIINISQNTNSASLAQSTTSPALATSIEEWLDMGHLRNGLEAFKRKMQDMIEHVDELDSMLLRSWDIGESQIEAFRSAGAKIKERLKHYVDEFDELIRSSSNMIEGVSLASQLEWNQIGRCDTFTNLRIAENGLKVAHHTRRDGELMKSIALLTMIFLPATFVATLFSMGFFNIEGVNGELLSVSPYIWLYFVVTIIITSLTLGTWYLLVMRRQKQSCTLDSEKQDGMSNEKGEPH